MKMTEKTSLTVIKMMNSLNEALEGETNPMLDSDEAHQKEQQNEMENLGDDRNNDCDSDSNDDDMPEMEKADSDEDDSDDDDSDDKDDDENGNENNTDETIDKSQQDFEETITPEGESKLRLTRGRGVTLACDKPRKNVTKETKKMSCKQAVRLNSQDKVCEESVDFMQDMHNVDADKAQTVVCD